MPPFSVTKRSRKVAVIGSGMSLGGVDLTEMRNDGYVICINDSWRIYPNPDIVISADTKNLPDRFIPCPHRVVICTPAPLALQAKLGTAGERFSYMDRRQKPGFSEDPDSIHSGENSGYAAFNLAYLMKPEWIFLFGIDLVDMTKHCHEHFFNPILPCEKLVARLPDNFSSTVPQLNKRGINVINGSTLSRVKDFTRCDPREAIRSWNFLGSEYAT